MLLGGLFVVSHANAAPKVLKPAWSSEAAVETLPTVVTDESRVFACLDSGIRCYDRATGRQKWIQATMTKNPTKVPIKPTLLKDFLLLVLPNEGNRLCIIDKRSGELSSLTTPDGQVIDSLVPAKNEAIVCLRGEGDPRSRLLVFTFDAKGKPRFEKTISPRLMSATNEPLFILDGQVHHVLNRGMEQAFISRLEINFDHFPLARHTSQVWSLPHGWDTFITLSGVDEYVREMPMERPLYSLSMWSLGGLGRQYWSYSSYVGDAHSLWLGFSSVVVWKDTVWTTGGRVYRVAKEPHDPMKVMAGLTNVFVAGASLFGVNGKDEILRFDGQRFKPFGVLPAPPKTWGTYVESYFFTGGIARWIRTAKDGVRKAKLEYFPLS